MQKRLLKFGFLAGLLMVLVACSSTSYQTRSYCTKNPDHCQKNQDIFIGGSR